MIERQHIEDVRRRLDGLEARISDPASMAVVSRYRDLMRQHAALKKRWARLDAYDRLMRQAEEHRALLADDDVDPELGELAREELLDIEQRLPAMEKAARLALVPEDPTDARNAIVEIRAGTGGDEAALFAGDLYRMYARFAERRGWRVGVLDASPSEAGGYKEVVFSVAGDEVYRRLKFESGVHRVQRVPATESQGRIHTSAATVAVFPEVEEEDEIEIPACELRVDIFCSSGPGGQSVNTTYSAIRITHLPSGIVAQSQDERSQHRNRDKAMTVLKSRLLEHRRAEEEARQGIARRSLIRTGDRSEKCRTYNYAQNRVTDHRIHLTLHSLDRVMEGEIAPLVEALEEADLEARLAAELASDAGPGARR